MAASFQEDIDYSMVQKGKLLGKGAFGSVFKVKYKGMTCAMKQLPEFQDGMNSKVKKVIASLKLEAKTLAALGHSPYIVQFVGTCIDDRTRMCMLMEYVNGKDLAKLIQDGMSEYKWDVRLRLTMEVSLGLDFIHSKNIIHRDIKSDNVLIEIDNDTLRAKIADFGVCRIEQDLKGLDTATFMGAGSPLWMAPEIFQKYGVDPSKKTDVYALGVVMWEIAALARPYSGVMDPQKIGLYKQDGIIEEVPPTTPPNYEALLRRCQHPDPLMRPFANDVALVLKRSLGLYETNIHAADAQDLSTIFGTRFYEPTSLMTKTGMFGPLDENKLDRFLQLFTQNPNDESAKDELFTMVRVDPDEDLGAFYVAVANLYFDGARLGRNYRLAIKYYELATDLNCLDGFYKLGIMYRFGYGLDSADNTKALQLFTRAAELGSASAQCSLGECYALGLGVEKNIPLALTYLNQSAESEFPQALYLLGYHYYNGEGIDKDYTVAFDMYHRAASLDHSDAQFSLGIMYKHGIGLVANDGEALKWFRKAAFQGHARAQNNVGSCYYFGLGAAKDRKEAVGWFKKSAMQDNPAAQHNLGECYANGRGVSQSYEEAFRWFRRAAEQCHPGAQRSVAISFFMGHGVVKDYAQALIWFQKSAEQGNARSQCALAQCYLKGQGTELDPTKGFKFALQAAESGQAEGQYMVASCYFNGIGVTKDYSQAFRWFYLAGEDGHSQAILALAACYRDGLGVPHSDEEAFNCYMRLADRGVADAESNVGTCYSAGKGVSQNLEQAVIFFEKAAKQNNPSAMTNLAQCYQTGRGVEKDSYKAVEWYKKASGLNSPFAMYNLGACYERAEGVEKSSYEAQSWYKKAADLGFEPAKKRLEELIERIDRKLKVDKNPDQSSTFVSTNLPSYDTNLTQTHLSTNSNRRKEKKENCNIM